MTGTSLVLDPAHQQALLKTKRKAFDASPAGRLTLAAPESKTLIDLAFAHGESLYAFESKILPRIVETLEIAERVRIKLMGKHQRIAGDCFPPRASQNWCTATRTKGRL